MNYNAYFKKPFLDIIFLYNGFIIIEKIIYNDNTIHYIITSFNDSVELSEETFLHFKEHYLDTDFLLKYFFSYYKEENDTNHTIFIYERTNFISDSKYIFDLEKSQILLILNTNKEKDLYFLRRNSLKIDISSQEISIIDKINLLNIFKLLTPETCKNILNRKNILEKHIFKFFIKKDNKSKRYLKENCPNLIL